MKLALAALCSLLLALAGTTWWALESGGVAIVETLAADGATRKTHVWFVESDGRLWLEAGTPENGWFVDVLAEPSLKFTAGNRTGRYLARPVEAAAAHDRVRSLIREKYGFRDRWIGLLIVDSSDSIAVRLDPPSPIRSKEID